MRQTTNELSLLAEKVMYYSQAKKNLDMAEKDMFEVKGQAPKWQAIVDEKRQALHAYIEKITEEPYYNKQLKRLG